MTGQEGQLEASERWGYGSDGRNLYYNPEARGYEILGVADKEPDYDFDTLVVFRKLDDGSLWWTADSGCSCPVPFEDHTDADLEPLTKATFDAFKAALRQHAAYSMGEVHPEKMDLERKVREALR